MLMRAFTAGICGAVSLPCAAWGQVRLDRADPSIVQQSLPATEAPPPPTAKLVTAQDAPEIADNLVVTPVIQAITIDGRGPIVAERFATLISQIIGTSLTRDELSRLAGAVADVAKREGYPLSTAMIEPQTLSQGVLRIKLSLGQVDAVRVIGAKNALADRILAEALVTGKPVRTIDLERAILLVSDIAGLRVKESRFVTQDGFGILLVSIEQDFASGYLQIDNRGSHEVGPLRSTALASFRGIAGAGDELALIASNTPLQPREFAFLRARYSAPVGTSGDILSASASYGRSNPGGALRPLDVVGVSTDFAAALSHPVIRTRARSLWAGIELRGLSVQQTVFGRKLRDDRLFTATANVNGSIQTGGGTLRGEVITIVGLPLAGVTREGDRDASRFDGDGRFVTLAYSIDWTRKLGGPFEIMLASTGQIASRPLLATMEIGAGGPQFGRAYDYAERTGDQGVLGSAELRASTGQLIAHVIDRSQVYSFIDGGTVSNLRSGIGGGSLLSAGGGVRLGRGHIDGMAEIAVPLNADRFDTLNKTPRISLRLARAF